MTQTNVRIILKTRTDILIEVKVMIKRFSGQEVFILIAAVAVLIFMYSTIIFSAPSYEASDLVVFEQHDNLNIEAVKGSKNFD